MASGLKPSFSGREALGSIAGGNVYIADTQNRRVRKVEPNGRVTSFSVQDVGPLDVAIDASGKVYFTEFLRIRTLEAETP
jgi:DNA-binding beta-propeller fold protein YncE